MCQPKLLMVVFHQPAHVAAIAGHACAARIGKGPTREGAPPVRLPWEVGTPCLNPRCVPLCSRCAGRGGSLHGPHHRCQHPGQADCAADAAGRGGHARGEPPRWRPAHGLLLPCHASTDMSCPAPACKPAVGQQGLRGRGYRGLRPTPQPALAGRVSCVGCGSQLLSPDRLAAAPGAYCGSQCVPRPHPSVPRRLSPWCGRTALSAPSAAQWARWWGRPC